MAKIYIKMRNIAINLLYLMNFMKHKGKHTEEKLYNCA